MYHISVVKYTKLTFHMRMKGVVSTILVDNSVKQRATTNALDYMKTGHAPVCGISTCSLQNNISLCTMSATYCFAQFL